jgi:hypothetical protein
LQTQSVRMNLRPGRLARFFACHSRSWGFLDFGRRRDSSQRRVIHHGRDGEDAAKALAQLLSGMVCAAWA